MTYRHVQTAPIYLLFVVMALITVVAGVLADGPTFVLFIGAAVFLLLALCFQRLTVRHDDDALRVEFGPIPVARRRVPYRRIRSVERARSGLLDGWGIHWMPGRGWIWNIWGRDCVRIRMDGSVLRIGTDDPDGLVRFLQERTGRKAPS